MTFSIVLLVYYRAITVNLYYKQKSPLNLTNFIKNSFLKLVWFSVS